MMEFSGEHGTTRRDLIRAVAATAAFSGIAAGIPFGSNTAYAVPARQKAATQEDWRFCGNCHGMFFSGRDGTYYRENQRCPAGGLHNPLGYNFVLPHRGIVPDGTTPLTPDEQQILNLVNAARNQDGCSVVLQVDPRLVGVTRAHSQDLADHPGPPGLWEKGDQGQQGHYGSDGSLSADRISKAVGTAGTENSYVEWFTGTAPPPSAQRAFDWWWQSKWGHKENLLNCNHRTTGVGIASGTGIIPVGQTNAGQSARFHYYTQAFVD